MGISYNTTVVRDGLVLHLDAANPKSYNGSGAVWKDLSGQGNNGTFSGGPVYDGTNKGSLIFDGTDDYIELGYKSELVSADITQEAWVNASSLVNWHGIISNMPSWGTGFSLQIGPIQKIAAMISGVYLTTSWTPSVNTWYHIIATHRSSDNLNVLYVNGVQENSVVQAVSYTANAVSRIGMFYTTNSLYFAGKISQVRTYNRALSASEVKQNFEALRGRYGV